MKDTYLRLGLTLMLICLVAGIALAYSYRLTRVRIEEQARGKEAAALATVLPVAVRFSEECPGKEINYYRGYAKDGRIVGYVFRGEAKGYSGIIRVVVGLEPGGRITGIKITEQKETPGLGDRIDRVPAEKTVWQALAGERTEKKVVSPPFQEQFRGKTLSDLKVVSGPSDRQIETITGATVSSQAVTKAVRDSLELFLRQQKTEAEMGGEQ